MQFAMSKLKIHNRILRNVSFFQFFSNKIPQPIGYLALYIESVKIFVRVQWFISGIMTDEAGIKG